MNWFKKYDGFGINVSHKTEPEEDLKEESWWTQNDGLDKVRELAEHIGCEYEERHYTKDLFEIPIEVCHSMGISKKDVLHAADEKYHNFINKLDWKYNDIYIKVSPDGDK